MKGTIIATPTSQGATRRNIRGSRSTQAHTKADPSKDTLESLKMITLTAQTAATRRKKRYRPEYIMTGTTAVMYTLAIAGVAASETDNGKIARIPPVSEFPSPSVRSAVPVTPTNQSPMDTTTKSPTPSISDITALDFDSERHTARVVIRQPTTK
ncbi:hypothetical protein JCM12141A_04290 [Mycolicibacterium hodleri]